MHVFEARAGEPERERLEGFIAERYQASFGVRPPVFAPRLIGIVGPAERLIAACGVRAVTDGFFSEAYVDGPIEHAAAVALGRDLARRRLFEITTMAAASATGLRRAVLAAIDFGRRQRCRACLFTATADLRELLDRHGVVAHALVPALPARRDDAGAWGRYYEHDPWVCVADQPPWQQTAAARPRLREAQAVA